MQDDVGIYAELIKNNPFWDIYDSQFEILEPSSPPEVPRILPPDDAWPVQAYYSLGLIVIVALLGLYIIIRNRWQRIKKIPKIYFNENYKWYCYQFTGEEPSLITGDESWLPKNYYFDINQEDFFYVKKNDDPDRPATIEQVRNAALPPKATFLLPVLFLLTGIGVIGFVFRSEYDSRYENYQKLLAEREYEQSLFDPFEDMCQLNSKTSLIPQLMSVQIVHDLPNGSNSPIAVERHFYLEGDTLSTRNGEVTLPTQLFLHNSPDQIVGNDGQNINFRISSSSNDNCTQGNTYFTELDPETGNTVAYLVPISDLKNLSLGPELGLYETKLFGVYEKSYLINASSYEVRSVQYRYSIDNIPGCDTVLEGTTYMPGFMGNGDGFKGQIVPRGTSPAETINVPDFQMCSSVLQLEFQ